MTTTTNPTHRRCPSCRVAAAGRFETLTFGSNWRDGGPAQRRCPECGHTATTAAFAVVREEHAVSQERRP